MEEQTGTVEESAGSFEKQAEGDEDDAGTAEEETEDAEEDAGVVVRPDRTVLDQVGRAAGEEEEEE